MRDECTKARVLQGSPRHLAEDSGSSRLACCGSLWFGGWWGAWGRVPVLSPMVQPARGTTLLPPSPAQSQSREKGAEGTCWQWWLPRYFFFRQEYLEYCFFFNAYKLEYFLGLEFLVLSITHGEAVSPQFGPGSQSTTLSPDMCQPCLYRGCLFGAGSLVQAGSRCPAARLAGESAEEVWETPRSGPGEGSAPPAPQHPPHGERLLEGPRDAGRALRGNWPVD